MDTRRLAHDQTWFLAIFVVKVSLGFLAFAIKPWLGLVFFAVYELYLWRELRGDRPATEPELEPLKLQRRRAVPTRAAVAAQTVGTAAAISYLLVLLRTQRLTPWRLTTAALFYGAFALTLGLTS